MPKQRPKDIAKQPQTWPHASPSLQNAGGSSKQIDINYANSRSHLHHFSSALPSRSRGPRAKTTTFEMCLAPICMVRSDIRSIHRFAILFLGTEEIVTSPCNKLEVCTIAIPKRDPVDPAVPLPRLRGESPDWHFLLTFSVRKACIGRYCTNELVEKVGRFT